MTREKSRNKLLMCLTGRLCWFISTVEGIKILWYDAFTNLKILAKVKNTATDEDIKNAIGLVGLDPESKAKVKTYSLGMKQKLAIAQAIFESPELLLLDEPTNALDEKSIKNIRELLKDIKKTGTTIIIASHNKDDLRILSEHTLKLEDGRMLC